MSSVMHLTEEDARLLFIGAMKEYLANGGDRCNLPPWLNKLRCAIERRFGLVYRPEGGPTFFIRPL